MIGSFSCQNPVRQQLRQFVERKFRSSGQDPVTVEDELYGISPATQRIEGVGAGQEEELAILRQAGPKSGDGVKGVVWPSVWPGPVHGGYFQPRIAGGCQLYHGHPVGEACPGTLRLEGLHRNRRQNHPVQIKPLDRFPRERKVAQMGRIEGTTEECNTHRSVLLYSGYSGRALRREGAIPYPEEGKCLDFHAYIALGSNLASGYGGPEENLRQAVSRLELLGRITAASSIYETAPVGDPDQPWFLNAALMMATKLAPAELLTRMLAIEREFGRKRDTARPNGPRTLDLDLLLVDGLTLSDPELILPHPAIALRRFVLAPLAEIAPDLRHPTLKMSIADLLRNLPDEGENCRSDVRMLHRLRG